MSSSQFNVYLPSADPSIWSLDEDDVLRFDDLYGSIVDSNDQPPGRSNSKNSLQLPSVEPVPQLASVPAPNGCLPFNHLPDIKLQFPLTNNLSMPMPVLSDCANDPRGQIINNAPVVNYNYHLNIPPPMQIDPPLPKESFDPPAILSQHNEIPNKSEPENINNSTLATFVDLKSYYEKGQVRLQGKSEQRLDYSTSFVRIYLLCPDKIKDMKAYVERYPDAAHILKDNIGRVPLKIIPGENKSWIKVNLDDAGCEVYKLSKVKGEERNRFHIVLELLFHETNTKERFHSGTFQVKSKPKQTDLLVEGMFEDEKPINLESDQKRKGIKRSRTDDHDVMASSPGSIGSTVFPEVITDHLQATTATIDQLKILQPIQTQRGDIAYHFKLNKRPSDPVLEEGDIIGFFEDSEGETEIKPLTCENVHDAKIAGVVSRSAWLEGKKPNEDEKDITDVVCVIGVVGVKVRGKVKNGERVYASLSSYPGVAMPEDVITHVTSNDLTLIGQSLETVEDTGPDQINLVSCFVSILLSIQTKYTVKAMTEMKSDVMGDVDVKIADERRRCIRGIVWKLSLLFIFLGLVAVLLYQLYAPQTAYRYWKCRQGSTGETSQFTFITSRLETARVYGEEFHYDDLMDKLDFDNVTKKEKDSFGEEHRYYLNIDRCAAGGLRSGVYGPEFFVLNNRCTIAYYHLDNHGYTRYRTGRMLTCSHIDNNQEATEEERPTTITTNQMEGNNSHCHNDVKFETGNASFTYFSPSQQKEVTAVGIQVDLDVIREKLSEPVNELVQPEVRYYFNVGRCRGTSGGPEFFAVVNTCDNSYYHSSSGNKWSKYRTAKEFKCYPPF